MANKYILTVEYDVVVGIFDSKDAAIAYKERFYDPNLYASDKGCRIEEVPYYNVGAEEILSSYGVYVFTMQKSGDITLFYTYDLFTTDISSIDNLFNKIPNVYVVFAKNLEEAWSMIREAKEKEE